MKVRIDKLRKYLAAENIDAAFIAILDMNNTSIMPGVRYLTGFSGSSAGLFVTRKSAIFISDFRYAGQSKKQVKGCKIVISKKDPITALEDIKEAHKKKLKILIEANRLRVCDKQKMQEKLPDAILIDSDGILEEMSICKDKTALDSIKEAVKISDEAFDRILGYVRPGLTEKDVAAELEYQMKVLGSEMDAFQTIVASGYRSALPHGIASTKKIKAGDFITFDFGATVNGYCSDITRTIVMGKANARQKKIYNIVAKAQMAGIRKVRAGIATKAVDAAARKVIERAGYGKNFGHGTGHGIGLEVHAGPRLHARSTEVLASNMVVTIEPGIYIAGWGGVRIEDDVVVRPGGSLVLNKASKKLLEL
jgi:Xaa-Pro aminopeptidase